MRRWSTLVISIAVGLSIGCGIGYAIALVRAGTNTVMVAHPSGDNFKRVFAGMGKLNALERLASNCTGESNIPSALSNESELIKDLREAADRNGLTPAINVAESRLATRSALLAERAKDPKLQSEQEARASRLLESAGWRDPSPAHMRQIIAALDLDHCGQSSPKEERTQ